MPSTKSSITITFGGVNFLLEPKAVGSELSFVNGKNSDEVVLNLNNFSGALVVSLAETKKENKSIIEEEPLSPPGASVQKVSPRQQQLSFGASTAKHNYCTVSVGKQENFIDLSTPILKSATAQNAPCKAVGHENQSSPELPRATHVDSPPRKKMKGDDENESLALGQSSDVDTTQGCGDTILDCDERSISTDNMETSIVEVDPTPTTIAKECKSLLAPTPRWGHSATVIDGDRLLIYGGQSESGTLKDLLVYSLNDDKWTKPVNCEGLPRQWHTATYLPERQLLICFGGEAPNKKGKITTTDQVMVLDTELMLWYPPSVSGLIPSGRSGHTASILPNSNDLLIFGGVKGTKWTNSVAVLDISRWKWDVPKILGDGPCPRSYHSATPMLKSNNKCWLVIFGGNDSVESYNTVHVLETNNNNWTWIDPLCSGDLPPPRTGHSATLLDDESTILVYGGWDPNADDDDDVDDVIMKDAYLLDTTTWIWTKVENDVVSRRVGHTSLFKDDCVMVFGGRTPEGFTNEFLTLQIPNIEVGLGA